MSSRCALVFGGLGYLGAACTQALRAQGWNVLTASRGNEAADVVTDASDWVNAAASQGPLGAVVWASGCNWNDSVLDDVDSLQRMLEGNLLYVQRTMRDLLLGGAVEQMASFVVLSSVWQETARRNKFSYIVSKSALTGLVRASVLDLAESHIRVNAVLPGPVDSDMTRRNLSSEQLAKFERETPIGRLVTAREVGETVAWLSSAASSGVNGQSIAVDGGWLGARDV